MTVQASIVERAQFEDVDTLRFLMRIRFDLLDDVRWHAEHRVPARGDRTVVVR